MALEEIPLQGFDIGRLFNVSLEQVIFAVIVLVAGYLIVRYLIGHLIEILHKSTSMPTVMVTQIRRSVSLLLYLFVVLIALDTLGIVDVDAVLISVSAVLALVLGFGMKDTINNIASGVWIVAMRVFDKGDEIEAAGQQGTVMDVSIMATEIKKLDNTRVIIPNGRIWNSPITNVTRMPTRMIVLAFGIGYGSSVEGAIRVALAVAKQHPKIHEDPLPIVRVVEMADSSVNLQLRAWTDTPDFYQARSDITRMLLEGLQQAEIEIPFPQVDVHMRD